VLALLNGEGGRAFIDRDLRLMTVFASQAALAIRNAQLFESNRRHTEQLGLANDIARIITASLDVEEVMHTTVRALHYDFGFASAAVLMHEPATDELVLRAQSGIYETDLALGSRQKANTGLNGAAFRSGETLVVNDTRSDGRLLRLVQAPPAALVAVPLRIGDEMLGILNVSSKRLNSFEPGDVAVIQALADQLAAAIGAARLYGETLAAKWRAETILREAQTGLVVLDEELRVVTLNPAAAAILGWPSDGVAGTPLTQLITDEAKIGALVREATSGEPRRIVEAHLEEVRRDVLVGVAYLAPGYLVSMSDVTALKEVDRLKSEIVANFSHELRTPLASIKAYTEILMDSADVAGDAANGHFLEIINQETDRLTDLINDVLDLARLEGGRPHVEYSQLHVADLISEAVNLLILPARARGIRFEPSIASDVPRVWADRQLMGMLIKNLASNAVKYNRDGGCVYINVWHETGSLYISVRDEGVGIPESALPNLFQKFYRVRSTTESGIQGTGLGLALTRAAAEAHGGDIVVRSQEGVGSEFCARIPLRTSPPRSKS
jgi:PAS domain S-box-containing protein